MFRAIDKWLPGYLASVARRPPAVAGTRHLMFCVADHFEPFRAGVGRNEATALVDTWCRGLPAAVAGVRDGDGKGPRHSFFFPQEDYEPACLDLLAGLCRNGHAEVEVHLHHQNDTEEQLGRKLAAFRDVLRQKHGLLGGDRAGRIRYGFIHGNWALCNSRPDGKWCGVNEELGVLIRTGCYADFTFPSAPSPTQPRLVNQLYYAADRPGRPCGHETGQCVVADGHNQSETGRALMLVTGPLALDWGRRKWGVLPRLENGDITGANPPVPERVDLWVRQHIHVRGRPDWIFVKVYTHGCLPDSMNVLLGDSMRGAYKHLLDSYNDGRRWVLHFVSAREMYNIIRAAEAGLAGQPGEYREYEISAPPVCRQAP